MSGSDRSKALVEFIGVTFQNADDEVIDSVVAKGPERSRIKPGMKRLRKAAGVQEQSSSDDEKARKEAKRKDTEEWVERMKGSMKKLKN